MWSTQNPTDIDATCVANPQDVFAALQKNAIDAVWLFRTEKFWTATLVTKDDTWVQYSYEITPCREEWWYTDRRHPTDITRTQSLLADAWRRDFTVNALYYTHVGVGTASSQPIWDALQVDDDELITYLSKQWRTYIPTIQLLILQHEDFINAIIIDGEINIPAIQQFCINHWLPYSSWDGIRLFLDPKKWLQDIAVQKLQTVGDADKRFNEDALRILRALRFVNVRNQAWHTFDFNKDTWNSIKKQYHLVQYLAKERIRDELVKVFSAHNPFGYVALLDEANILQYIFPSLLRCKHNEQPIRYHPFDTYTHILLTLYHLQQINTSYLVKLWMLYHDVGKPDQYHYYAQCKTKEEIEALHWSWYNHSVCWAEFAEKDFAALSFSSKEIEEIARYVAMHMRPWQILDARHDNQRKKVRLLYSEYGYDRIKNLFDICKADRLWQYNPIQSQEIDAVTVLYNHLDYLRDNEWQFTMKDMIINGDDIMHHFGLQPWKHIWDMLQKAFERVLHEKDDRNTKHAILAYLKGNLPDGK